MTTRAIGEAEMSFDEALDHVGLSTADRIAACGIRQLARHAAQSGDQAAYNLLRQRRQAAGGNVAQVCSWPAFSEFSLSLVTARPWFRPRCRWCIAD
jgi:hypothetical protein